MEIMQGKCQSKAIPELLKKKRNKKIRTPKTTVIPISMHIAVINLGLEHSVYERNQPSVL
jgi:hypothetical protein